MLAKVVSSPLPKRRVLREMNVPRVPTTGGTGVSTSMGSRIMQEGPSPHGTG